MARLALGAMRQRSEAAFSPGTEMPKARGPNSEDRAATPRPVPLLRKNWRRVRAVLSSKMERMVSVSGYIKRPPLPGPLLARRGRRLRLQLAGETPALPGFHFVK